MSKLCSDCGLSMEGPSGHDCLLSAYARIKELEGEVDCGSDDILCLTHKNTGKACNKHLQIASKFVATELKQAEAEVERLAQESRQNEEQLILASESLDDRTEEMFKVRSILNALVKEPHGCPQCHSGKLIKKGNDHWPDCPYNLAVPYLDGGGK